MIKAEIIGAASVISKLKRLSPRVELALIREVGRLSTQLERRVKQKLSGEVLHVRTGRLRRSIHQEVSSSDTEVTGIVGTDVEYAAAHEYGFSGTETVRAHIRNLTKTRTLSLTGKLLKHPVKISTGSTMVRAFTRHANTPKSSFLLSALREMRPEILEGLRAAVRRATGE